MNKIFIKWFWVIVFLVVLSSSCSTSGTKLTDSRLNKEYSGDLMSNILVIAVTGNEKSRQKFERTFVEHLNASGLEAVSSYDAISIPGDLKMEKDMILKAVEKYGNDAVIVTHVKSYDEEEVYTRGQLGPRGFYGYYGTRYAYTHDLGYSSTNTTVKLETNLYDVKTEGLIWSGISRTWNTESENQAHYDIIKVVVDDLKKNNLIAHPKK